MRRVIVRHIPEPSAQRLLLEKGDIDIARNLSPDQIEGIAGNAEIVVEAFPKADIHYLGLNQKDERLANPKVREALRWLVDYQGMAGVPARPVQGASGVLAIRLLRLADRHALPPGRCQGEGPARRGGLSRRPRGRARRRQHSPWNDIAQAIQATMGEAGVKVSIVPGEQKQVITKYRARNHQIVLLTGRPTTWTRTPTPTPSRATRTTRMMRSRADRLAQQLGDPRADQDDRRRGARARPREAQGEVPRAAEDVQADTPFIIMFQNTEQVARRANVEGFVSGPTFDTVFYRLVTK